MKGGRLTFYILDHPLLPTPYNFRFTVEKFAQGFEHLGWEVRVVRRVGEITAPGFVMLADHDCFHGWADGRLEPLFGLVPQIRSRTKLTSWPGRRGQLRVLKKLAGQLEQRDEIMAIAWLWNRDKRLFDELGIPVIFTGECCREQPQNPRRRTWHAFSREVSNALPLEFGAAVDPGRIGERCENQAVDCSYVGSWTYREDWQAHFRSDPRNRIVGTPPWINESDRIEIFRNSKVVLGLHQPANIDDALPVERTYEALAYGAILITDNPAAVEATEGIGLYAGDLDRARELARYYVTHERERQELRSRGFDFARRRGTYAHRASEFIALRDELIAG
jgi:Glycosyl transferases group 1